MADDIMIDFDSLSDSIKKMPLSVECYNAFSGTSFKLADALKQMLNSLDLDMVTDKHNIINPDCVLWHKRSVTDQLFDAISEMIGKKEISAKRGTFNQYMSVDDAMKYFMEARHVDMSTPNNTDVYDKYVVLKSLYTGFIPVLGTFKKEGQHKYVCEFSFKNRKDVFARCFFYVTGGNNLLISTYMEYDTDGVRSLIGDGQLAETVIKNINSTFAETALPNARRYFEMLLTEMLNNKYNNMFRRYPVNTMPLIDGKQANSVYTMSENPCSAEDFNALLQEFNSAN